MMKTMFRFSHFMIDSVMQTIQLHRGNLPADTLRTGWNRSTGKKVLQNKLRRAKEQSWYLYCNQPEQNQLNWLAYSLTSVTAPFFYISLLYQKTPYPCLCGRHRY